MFFLNGTAKENYIMVRTLMAGVAGTYVALCDETNSTALAFLPPIVKLLWNDFSIIRIKSVS